LNCDRNNLAANVVPSAVRCGNAGPMRERKSQADEELLETSDELLDELGELKQVEEQKRREPISTPRFHELADRAVELSRRIFDTAREQDQTGREIESGSPPIDELADRRERRDRDRR
jgi:hypothetical protein